MRILPEVPNLREDEVYLPSRSHVLRGNARLNALRVLDAERLGSSFHAEHGTREGVNTCFYSKLDRRAFFNRVALKATMMDDPLIASAPISGRRMMPILANNPAAMGMAVRL